ncbi:unnamed protein product [Vitrella brassicaformis CCMP3155]|uniref:Uncharacterized protein n=1 Tax=Vitrella brassicaformis (strain CCMP3155) TaxID=1169540 RepID=A0A0G4EIK7_VITBC|nr:unnamed protein product [Vitrella brassicaformis CCMP3155]|eukprot:CEL96833.1 unnamed protein product [Vitrella brassicaformis CCMP3155]
MFRRGSLPEGGSKGRPRILTYSAGKGGPDGKDPNQVRLDAARRCTRQIQRVPIMTHEWFHLVDNIEHLYRLASLESLMPHVETMKEAENGSRAVGRASEGTLWDQDIREDVIRIMVEEAKVNLCLRLLHEFKQLQNRPDEMDRHIDRACDKEGMPKSTVLSRMAAFEEALGLLLRQGFTHVETLQLTDVPLIARHIELVLRNANKRPLDCDASADPEPQRFREDSSTSSSASLSGKPVQFVSTKGSSSELKLDGHRRGSDERRGSGLKIKAWDIEGQNGTQRPLRLQETVVLAYFHSVAQHIEKLNEAEVVSVLCDCGLLELVPNHIVANCATYPSEMRALALEAVSLLCASEEFQARWKESFTKEGGTGRKAAFLALEPLAKDILLQKPDMKTSLRCLRDFIAKLKRH